MRPADRWRALLPDPRTAAFHGISHSNPRTKPRSFSSLCAPPDVGSKLSPGSAPHADGGHAAARRRWPGHRTRSTGGRRVQLGPPAGPGAVPWALAAVATGCHTGGPGGSPRRHAEKGAVVTTRNAGAGHRDPGGGVGGHRRAWPGPRPTRSGSCPSECPGWTVRDVLSHLIGIERALLGDPAPAPARELPPHVQNEVGARNEAWVAARRVAVRARTSCASSPTSRPGAWRDLRSWPAARFDEIGPSPGGRGPVPRVHERPGHGLLGARAGHPCGHGPTRARLGARRAAVARPLVRRPCPSWWASRRERPRGRRCASSCAGRCRGASTWWCATAVPRPCPRSTGGHDRPRHGHGGLLASGVRPGGREGRPARRPRGGRR